MLRSFYFLLILLVIFFFYCSEEETTEPEPVVLIYGEAKLISKLTDEQNNVLGDTTVAAAGIEVILIKNNEQVAITTTDETGIFVFGNIDLGTYTIKARIKHILFESESDESDSLEFWFPFLDYYAGLFSIPIPEDLSDSDFEFETAYPNPDDDIVRIRYNHSQTMNLKIDIYDPQSELIRNYDNVTNQEGGSFVVLWDFTDNNISAVPPGIYFIYAESDSLPLYVTNAVKK